MLWIPALLVGTGLGALLLPKFLSSAMKPAPPASSFAVGDIVKPLKSTITVLEKPPPEKGQSMDIEPMGGSEAKKMGGLLVTETGPQLQGYIGVFAGMFGNIRKTEGYIHSSVVSK